MKTYRAMGPHLTVAASIRARPGPRNSSAPNKRRRGCFHPLCRSPCGGQFVAGCAGAGAASPAGTAGLVPALLSGAAVGAGVVVAGVVVAGVVAAGAEVVSVVAGVAAGAGVVAGAGLAGTATSGASWLAGVAGAAGAGAGAVPGAAVPPAAWSRCACAALRASSTLWAGAGLPSVVVVAGFEEAAALSRIDWVVRSAPLTRVRPMAVAKNRAARIPVLRVRMLAV